MYFMGSHLAPVSAGGVVPLDRAVLVHCDGVSREGPSARNIFEDRIRCAGHAQTAEGSASSVLINVSLGEFCVSYSIFHLVISLLVDAASTYFAKKIANASSGVILHS